MMIAKAPSLKLSSRRVSGSPRRWSSAAACAGVSVVALGEFSGPDDDPPETALAAIGDEGDTSGACLCGTTRSAVRGVSGTRSDGIVEDHTNGVPLAGA